MKSDHWRRLRPLLDQALELDGDARRHFIDSLDDVDAELRSELTRLLAEHEGLGPQTMPNAMDLAAPAVADRVHEDAALDEARVGQSIGPYRLSRLLGAGGMGAVYLAEHLDDGFTHAVALKVVRKALGSGSAGDRFERERQILANLKHPGIALLFDAGQTPEGQPFYTMEHVDGEPITEYCKRRNESTAGRARLLLQVAVTLAYAHQNLIMHRDIKPSNVLVTRDGRVKLIDFGLAKLLDEQLVPTMTQTGLGPMTPVYAAPEQFEGRATTVATDIYQFGVLCFLVLADNLPYRADPSDNLRWARAVLEEEPMTLARAAREGAARSMGSAKQERGQIDLPADLDAIVRKCLAKAPDNRYRSADALIGDLEAFLGGRPVSARSAGFGYFAWRFVQRHRYAVAASAAAVLAIVIVGITALWQSKVAAEHAERAERESEIREITRAMLTDLLRVGPASATSERPHSALEALDQGTERTLRVLGTNTQHRALAVSVLAQSYLDLDHPQRAQDLVLATLPALRDRQDLLPEILQQNLLLARASVELGDLDTSRKTLADAETSIEQMHLPHDAPSRLADAMVHVQIERHDGRQEQAREISARLLQEYDHPDVNRTIEFADLLRSHAKQSYDDAEASRLFERAWRISSTLYGKDSPAALDDERGMIIRDLHGPHRLDTDKLLSRQEARVRAAFGDRSLDYADVVLIRCEMYDDAHQFADAVGCWNRVLGIYESAPDAETRLAVAYENVAAALVKLGKPTDALPFYERELAVRLKNFAPTNQNVIHSRLQIAKTRCLAGDPDTATRDWDDAIDDYVASVGPLHPWEAVYAAYFATCLLDANRVESARSVMERHGKLDPPRKNITDEDRADVQKVWDRLAKML